MKRLLWLLLLPLLTACSKEEEEEARQLELSAAEIVLRSDAGSTAVVKVTASGAWTLSTAGTLYTASPAGGGAGQTAVTLTASEKNTGHIRRTLGTVTFRLSDGGGVRTLEVKQSPATATQTLLLYMAGTSLMTYYEENIDWVKEAVSEHVPGDGRILVCYQPKSNSSAELSEIYYDTATQEAASRILETYTSFDAGNPASVQQMLADVATCAPAQEYGMVIGCHGKAWIPVSEEPLPMSQFYPVYDPWVTAPGAMQTRSFGDMGHELEITELAAAIEAQSYTLDYLVFDACFMANIETLYDLRNSASKIIASPCEIMGAGFPYDRTFPYFFTDDGASNDLAQVCWEFWNFYQNDWESIHSLQSGCISLAVTSELEELANVMREVNAAGKSAYDINDLQIYEGMPQHLFFDLGHWVNLSCADMGKIDKFKTQLNKVFPAQYLHHTPGFYTAYDNEMYPITYYSGVTLSEPSVVYTELNKQTAWYRATH